MNNLTTTTKRKIPPTTFVLDADTKEKLVVLANDQQRSLSGLLRWLIHREYNANYVLTDQGREALKQNEGK